MRVNGNLETGSDTFFIGEEEAMEGKAELVKQDARVDNVVTETTQGNGSAQNVEILTLRQRLAASIAQKNENKRKRAAEEEGRGEEGNAKKKTVSRLFGAYTLPTGKETEADGQDKTESDGKESDDDGNEEDNQSIFSEEGFEGTGEEWQSQDRSSPVENHLEGDCEPGRRNDERKVSDHPVSNNEEEESEEEEGSGGEGGNWTGNSSVFSEEGFEDNESSRDTLPGEVVSTMPNSHHSSISTRYNSALFRGMEYETPQANVLVSSLGKVDGRRLSRRDNAILGVALREFSVPATPTAVDSSLPSAHSSIVGAAPSLQSFRPFSAQGRRIVRGQDPVPSNMLFTKETFTHLPVEVASQYRRDFLLPSGKNAFLLVKRVATSTTGSLD